MSEFVTINRKPINWAPQNPISVENNSVDFTPILICFFLVLKLTVNGFN